MAAASYYSSLPPNQHHSSGQHYSPDQRYSSGHQYSPDLQYSAGHPGHLSHDTTNSLKPFALTAQQTWQAEHTQLQKGDKRLKTRIRVLRILQRVVCMLISIAALVPIAMTLHKFLTTKDIYLDAPAAGGGTINRNAWALKNKTWPTYVYFATAVVSTTIHLFVLLGYLCSIRTSNILDTIGTWVASLEMGGQLVVWIVVAAIYRYEKEKTENGKHNDLWGWTCSATAQALQSTFEDVVPFDQYCDIQTAGWYAGLVQIGAIILSIVIWFFAWRRKKSKAVVRRSAQRGLEGFEGHRHQHV